MEFDPVAAARDPLAWPAALARIESADDAFAFVRAAEEAFPGLVEGTGAPLLDPLLCTPGFVELSKQHELHRHLGFRLAWLGLVDAAEVNRDTAPRVMADLLALGARELGSHRGKTLLNVAERAYAGSFRPALAAAILDASAAPAWLLREVLGEPWERSAAEVAALALASDDVAAVVQRYEDPDLVAALLEGVEGLDAHRRLQVFLVAAGRGLHASPELLRGAFLLRDEYPENRSARLARALAQLGDDERAKLLLAEPRLPWMYIACSADPAVIDAAVKALEDVSNVDHPWMLRAFHDWKDAGLRALASSPGAKAREVETILADLDRHRATRRPRPDLADLRSTLRVAIEAALDSLDADPAAAPSRSLLDPVLAFGRGHHETAAESPFLQGWSSAWVEAFPRASLVSLLRRFTTTATATAAEDVPEPFHARLTQALETMVQAPLPADRQDDVATSALAVLQRVSRDAVGRARVARRFWETFLLETIPAIARTARVEDAREYLLEQSVPGVEVFFQMIEASLPLDPPLDVAKGTPPWDALSDSLTNGLDSLGDVDVRIVWRRARAWMPVASDYAIALATMTDVARALSEPGSGRTVTLEIP
jgi:hypothetical protein